MLVVDRSLLDREGMGKHKSSRFPSVRSEAAAGPSKEGQRAKERERESDVQIVYDHKCRKAYLEKPCLTIVVFNL